MKYIYFLTLQRISYQYREILRCPDIYIIDLNQFLLLFLLTITMQKYFSSSPKLLFNYLSLNLPCFLWFDLGTLKIILLRSPALGSEQASFYFLPMAIRPLVPVHYSLTVLGNECLLWLCLSLMSVRYALH